MEKNRVRIGLVLIIFSTLTFSQPAHAGFFKKAMKKILDALGGREESPSREPGGKPSGKPTNPPPTNQPGSGNSDQDDDLPTGNAPGPGCNTEPPKPPTPSPGNENFPWGNPAIGGRKILAAKYQSCRILDNVAGTGTEDKRNPQPQILGTWKRDQPRLYPHDGPGCIDMSGSSTLQYSQERRHTRVENNKMMVLEQGSDCSSFVTNAMKAAGLKMTKDSILNDGNEETTASINGAVGKSNACLETPTITAENPIQSGDILNNIMTVKTKWSTKTTGHVVMIDRVEKDPFNIENILNKYDGDKASRVWKKRDLAMKECEGLNVNDMNFSIIHSSISHGTSGIMRQHISAVNSPKTVDVIKQVAVLTCKNAVDNLPTRNVPFNPGERRDDVRMNMRAKSKFLRHKGKKEPRCIFDKKPEVQGEKCINECLQNYTSN